MVSAAKLIVIHSLAFLWDAWALSSQNVPFEIPFSSRRGHVAPPQQPVGSILIMDHLNINYERGRQDWLMAFYFDFLKCSIDPRKKENIEKGKGTVWANIGAHQFHLPEGKPDAQVLQGFITLSYPNLTGLLDRFSQVKPALEGSLFDVVHVSRSEENYLQISDPWGTMFYVIEGSSLDRDERGLQDGGDLSEGYAIKDITFYTPPSTDNLGVARFYETVLGAPILSGSVDRSVVSVGPRQTLSFVAAPNKQKTVIKHEDLRDDEVEPPTPDFPNYMSNYGPHVSLYVADLPLLYRRADELKLTYVNPRFKRRAYTLDEAIDDCMFRCLDIKDPLNAESGVLLRLEHEVRSVIKRNGSMYKSCPFDTIPAVCRERET